MSRSTVLFLGADPTGGTFAIEEEFRLVSAELRACGRGELDVECDLDIQPSELQRRLNQYSPDLLHFSGHITEEAGLMLVDQNGKGHLVSGDLICRILTGTARSIRCIVLNACNGDVLAPALLSAAEVVIAMQGMVTVRAAHAFSVRFYEAIAGGRSVHDAFQQGLLEVELAGYHPELDAQLLERSPGLARHMRFATEGAPTAPGSGAAPTRIMPPLRTGIFISYAHRDVDWMGRLSTMLRPLERSFGIEVWDDRRIAASADWRQEIESALARARIAVLLVSPDFLASEFIWQKEFPVILAARKEGQLDVLWCYLMPCLVGETELSAIQAAHDPLQPIVSMPPGEQDEAFLQVAKRVSQILRA